MPRLKGDAHKGAYTTLLKAFKTRNGYTYRKGDAILREVIHTIQDLLAQGEMVVLPELGYLYPTFCRVKRRRHPGQPHRLSGDYIKVVFRVSDKFREEKLRGLVDA